MDGANSRVEGTDGWERRPSLLDDACQRVLLRSGTYDQLMAAKYDFVSQQVQAGETYQAAHMAAVKCITRNFSQKAKQIVARQVNCRIEDVDPQTRMFASAVGTSIKTSASAGSGKTSALVMRCEFLMDVMGLDPDNIMVLAFNRKAREEVQFRLEQKLGERGAMVRVKTFHGLSVSTLAHAGELSEQTLTIEDAAQNTVMLRAAEITADNRFFADCRSRFSGSEWSWMIKQPEDKFNRAMVGFLASGTSFLRVNHGSGRAIKDTFFTQACKRTAQNYAAMMAHEAQIDSEAVVRRAAKIVEQTSHPSGHVFGDVRALMVDECQDMSTSFFSMIMALTKANPSMDLVAVGDIRQQINGFMGATTEFFEKLTDHFFPYVKMVLPMNRRSSQKIVELGNLITSEMGQRPSIPSIGKEKGEVALICAERNGLPKAQIKEAAPRWIADQVSVLIEKGWRDDDERGVGRGTWGLISQHRQLHGVDISQILEMAGYRGVQGIETITSHSSKGLEWDRVILLDVSSDFYPSKHPADALMQDLRIAGETEHEGRRLFYVACTRARSDLFMLSYTDTCRPLAEGLKKQGLVRRARRASLLQYSENP